MRRNKKTTDGCGVWGVGAQLQGRVRAFCAVAVRFASKRKGVMVG